MDAGNFADVFDDGFEQNQSQNNRARPYQTKTRNAPRGGKRRFAPVQQQDGSSKKRRVAWRKPAGQERPQGHDKAPMVLSRSMFQRRRFYQILCSNFGATMLCEIVFNSIQFRDFRTAANVSVYQLTYCVVLAQWARLASVSTELGYIIGDVPDLSKLINSVKGLQLPAVLAKYVECLGSYTAASGVALAPWFSSRPNMQSRHISHIDPDDLLEQAGREVPDNYWSIDRDWIALWNQATTRPSRLGMHFRPIKWAELDGTPEFIVSPARGDEGYIRPTAPQLLTDAEGQLGSVYRFREFAELRHWPEQTALVCTKLAFGTEFHPEEFWSGVVTTSFTTQPERT